jgi:tetratricopeptide (TPR) repeat protein
MLVYLRKSLLKKTPFMNDSLRVVYLLALAGLLGWLAWQVFRQVRRNLSVEGVINEVQPKLKQGTATAQEFYNLGCAFLEKRLYSDSMGCFKRAIEAEPDFAEAYNNLGFCYFQQNQFDVAIRQYKEAIRIKPDYVSALNNLGHAYEQKSQAEQALEVYEKVLATSPTNPTAERRARALRKRVPSA